MDTNQKRETISGDIMLSLRHHDNSFMQLVNKQVNKQISHTFFFVLNLRLPCSWKICKAADTDGWICHILKVNAFQRNRSYLDEYVQLNSVKTICVFQKY
jgi:hypothetical protein|uniref:Uncharacterized protein n=1 Tax=Sipha flava TaxID=143950 RepID=A0A2S2R475_9HEMI